MYKILAIIFFGFSFSITTEKIYDNSWALVIGIDKYQNVQKLNYAVDDAESIKDILINSFDFPANNISILTNEEATKENILKSFANITKNAKINDRVLVFFAGHGETMDLPGGGEKGYLIPVEGDSKELYLTAIPMDELKEIALMSEAKHMLYLVDACYGGIAAVGSRGLEPEKTPNYINKITKFQSRQVITAGGRGEKVIEKPEWGHSAFTLNLERGLKDGAADINADGYITANELGLFLSEKVTIDSENQQTPIYGRMTSQEGEFIFILNNEIEDDKSSENESSKLGVIDYDVLASKIAAQLEGGNKEEKKVKVQKNKRTKSVESQPVKEPALFNIDKRESWYYYISYSLATAHTYPDDFTDGWVDIKIEDVNTSGWIDEQTNFAMEFIGIYKHISPKLIGGFVYDLSNDYIGYNYSEHSLNYAYMNIDHQFYGLSIIGYLSEFGDGFFYKGDYGRATIDIRQKASNLTDDEDYTYTEEGTGFGFGIGYSLYFKQLKKTRAFVSLNYSLRNIDLTGEGEVFEDFDSYSKIGLNFGLIF